jgi:hypothetical protein
MVVMFQSVLEWPQRFYRFVLDMEVVLDRMSVHARLDMDRMSVTNPSVLANWQMMDKYVMGMEYVRDPINVFVIECMKLMTVVDLNVLGSVIAIH